MDAATVLPITALEAALAISSSFTARVALLEEYLQTLFHPLVIDYRYSLVQAAVAQLTNPVSSPASITQVADQLSVTPKSLTRYFQQLVGAGPKRYAQLVRFKAALTLYRHQGQAFDYEAAGYADFAHFARASRRLLGQPLGAL
ncbi:helix-turn-helix domain-containing protein [Hymenobacter cellulosivorans]|uniref:Helix-turn-helix domain-containing protein n=1 Tax=Hymenobacter cellulosivorans TaxID=2932249 RepID=A0ABY4FE86_9BACT|nr:helix-turn-helix domain-containing protein [Hymenobacter cellulosivorans]UOQ52766.1 helix-turn-helix domain-containing protein [Hymenobacter cellulosivorans]